jgi:hypothetical protein
MRRIAPVLFVVVASGLAAQAPGRPAAPSPGPPGATLSGIVFDSLTDAVLKGATVVVEGSSRTALTDADGRYVFDLDSLGEGTRTLSFFHPALDTLGMAAPARTVTLHRGVSEVVDLAVPSAATITAAFCPDSMRGGGRALLLGEVRDVDADRALPGAYVVVQWSSMEIGNASIRRLPRAMNARADSSGFFRLCGLPSGIVLRAEARLGQKASGWIDLTLEPRGVTMMQLLVGEKPPPAVAAAGGTPAAGAAAPAAQPPPVATVGTASLSGTVIGPDGAPLEGAALFLIGTEISARSDFKGVFRMSGLPAGTRTVEVRMLSYQPKRYIVNLSSRRDAHLAAVLDQRAQVLDPVIVLASDKSVIPGFDARKARSNGYFYTKKDMESSADQSMTAFFRRVPGIQVLLVNGQNQVVVSRSLSSQCGQVQWYVDGVAYDPQNDNMDDMFRPYEIEGIEVYESADDVPIQYQGNHSQCGTILIWTTRAHPKQKGAPPPAPTTPP